jgi:EF-P beta-lysylation protein EpmB
MITATPLTRHISRWQAELADGIATTGELLDVLGLDEAALRAAGIAPEAASAAASGAAFPLRVPRSFVARMRRGDPLDPLLRQVLPLAAEHTDVPGFGPDPLGEADAARAPGLLHKYAGRALLVTTGACAVHCRYCFRRDFPYAGIAGPDGRWQAALDALARDPSITEVILSGGDPWSLSDRRLRQLTTQLAEIPHLAALRVHTRLPIVLPARVDEGLLAWLGELPWPAVTVVVHANHPREIDGDVERALRALHGTGAVVLNQSVLLAGVNDDADTLEALSRTLHRCGVLPYYLHLLDRVRSVAHFEVPEQTGRLIVAQLGARLPGYLVPRLVREQAGAPAKTVLAAGLPPPGH